MDVAGWVSIMSYNQSVVDVRGKGVGSTWILQYLKGRRIGSRGADQQQEHAYWNGRLTFH
jgi:hypothetical protein